MFGKRRQGRRGISQDQQAKANNHRRKQCVERLEPRLLLSSTYTWQNAAIGAGGFVDGVFYDPGNQNVIYARTDIGGLWKTTNDGQSWSQLLDFVGNSASSSGNGSFWQQFDVLSFAIDPNNSSNIYALVGNTGTGTVEGSFLHSSDGGATWGTTALSFAVNGNSTGRGFGERIAVDPNNSNVIYIGSDAAVGVWQSTNQGLSFSKLTGISATANTSFIAIPSNSQSSLQGTTIVGGVTVSDDVYVGISSTGSTSGTNLDESTNGGTTFTLLTGTGTLPNRWIPGHAEFSGGYLYLGYSNASQPNSTATTGGVFRFTPGTTSSNGVWANISPVTPGGGNPAFGYDSIGVDPENPNTLVVTSVDDYSGPDQIWRTTNANAATPTWTELFDVAAAGNSGFGGFNSTRDTSNAPWIAAYGDGIGNWATSVAINPFNSSQLMYGTGQGIWATDNATSNTQLTAANSWYFPDNGIEFTASIHLSAPSAGAPLLSSVGDINGFLHTTLTSSPTPGGLAPGQNYTGNPNTSNTGALGNDTSNDFAQQNPNDLVYVSSGGTVGSTNTYGAYSTNGGVTWTQFAANSAGSGNGTVAMSADGSTIVWVPSGQLPYFSTNDGSSWTAASLASLPPTASITSLTQTGGVATAVTSTTNGFAVGELVTVAGATPTGYNGTFYIQSIISPTSFTYTVSSSLAATATGTITASVKLGTGGTVVSDRVNANVFYYSTENSNDNGWQLFISTDGGHTFSPDGAAQSNGNITLVANPFTAGDLWFSSYIGIYHSTNSGATFTQNNVIGYNNVPTMALGAPAPGQTSPAIYIYGQIGSFTGVYRSDDGGATWISLNDTTQQFGGLVDEMAADPNVFGRVYIGTNGNGIFVGNPASSLPTNWVDADINTPGNPGWATSATTLSTGTTLNQWTIDGGGAGVSGTSDQFNFAYQPLSGSNVISAQLLSMTNADGSNGTPLAGVMVRGGASSSDPFAAMAQTAGNSLVFEYRTTTGGSVSSVSLGSAPVGSEYVQIVQNGNNFSGYYSSDGVAWTQLGSTVAIAAMPATANVGLFSSADYNPQLTAATFTNVNLSSGPAVATPAAAAPNPVTGTTTALSVLGIENGNDAGLTYTWSDTGPSGVTFTDSANGTNAAKNITANFTQAGSYNFLVTITDGNGLTITSNTDVTVQQTPTGVTVTPSSTTIATGGTQQFSATATDQFGNSIASPTFTWGITGSDNSIDGTGLATLGSTPGTYTVTATLGAASNTASITTEVAPAVTAFQVNDGNIQRSMVDSLTLTFNEAVTLSPGAITLNLLSQTGGASTPITNFNLNSPDGGTTWVLTFTDPSYIGQSLPDGAYEVSALASGVSSNGLNMSADQNFTFYRLYGDFAGQGVVNGDDFTELVGVLGKQTNSSDWYIDYNNDGVISGTDFTAFVGRLGKSISIPSLPSVVLLAAAPPVVTTPTPTTTSTTKTTAVPSVVATTTTPPKPAAKQKPRHGHR